jgi:fibulin 1/2
LVIGSTSQQCSTEGFAFGSPWDDIIEDCCTDIREGEAEDNSEESKTGNF